VITGAMVAFVALAAEKLLLEEVLHLELWKQALAPGIGLLVAILVLRWADAGQPLSPATSEEYIRAYHSRSDVVRVLQLPFRILAGIATVGMGGAVGLEGPSVYAGATAGSAVQHRLGWLFREKDGKALLVAGAAAGVSAIFQAPATGVLFALESPYKGDLGRRALLPSLISSAVSYITFILITQFDELPFDVPFDKVSTNVGFGNEELLGAVAVGALCGAGAVVFSRVVKWAKTINQTYPWWMLWFLGSAVLAGLVVLSDAAFEAPLSLGPTAEGQLLTWVLNSEESLWLLGLLLVVRLVATSTVLASGGVGGVFIPLAVFGLIVGRLVGGWIELGPRELAFFPFIGVAAFLAAGYRTPLAAVMFVAESTGRASFVVPGLIAVAVTQVVIGSSSVSSYQRDTRTGHLERRFQLPVTSAMRTDFRTVLPTDSLSEFVWGLAFPRKQLEAVVADEAGHFVGVIRLHDAREHDRDEWVEVSVSDAMVTNITPATLSWTLREVTQQMADADLEIYPVVDTGGRVVGVITDDAIVKLDELLEDQ
jgi:chloride channel protein, CIC family